ncbi:MAG: efflux transporter outer membrane subunit [Desulfobacteraceae bacterium]|nr:MAG: efflux transporter outer membrane subunit [Desulfobacteraceae bacterium]
MNRCSAPQKDAALKTAGLIAAALSLLMLAGCPAVGPDYVRPETELPPAWHSQTQDGLTPATPEPQALANWWTTLDDPMLASLIQRAADGNLDLQTAQARVREARARRGISQADFYPSLDAGASATKVRSSAGTGFGRRTELYETGFDALWELDVFGGVRRSVEAADADLQASQEDLGSVLVSLLAEVALNYIDVRTLQTRITVAVANAQAQEETYQLTRSRYEAGLTDELAVQSALYTLAGTRAEIPVLRTGLESAMNRLAVLLGVAPGVLHAELRVPSDIPVPPVSVAVGVPADTIRRRPDVRRAERQLAAQTALIGVATADLYPRFVLLGSLGYEALSTGDLFSSGSLAWRIGPQVSWRLFSGGAVRQNIEVQSARQEQTLKQYQATVLGALEEAENTLTAYIGEQARRDALVTATQAAAQAFQLARDQYQAGLVDFSEVLIAQRSLLSFEDQLALSTGAVTANLVRIYKSLGGGWAVPAPDKDAGAEAAAQAR